MNQIIIVLFLLIPMSLFANVNLSDLIDIAYKHNPTILSASHMIDAEDSLVTSSYTLEDPMIGINTIDRNMKTNYGTISQKIRFPTKYYYEGKAQKNKANALKYKKEMVKLEIRQRVISLYYSIYSIQKIIELTMANMETVKEFSRVAEKKYAAGKSPQGDSMKAHFELTQLELDLIRLKQEEESLQGFLNAVLNEKESTKINFEGVTLKTPLFKNNLISKKIPELTQTLKVKSPNLLNQEMNLKESEAKQSLSKWEFAPDIQIQYQQRISGMPDDSKIYSIGITFPLWFWNKGSRASAATSKKIAQDFQLVEGTKNLLANIIDLSGKVKTEEKTLKIYETSLIPQAQGAYHSTRSSYQANKTSFLDLIDSERSLYRVKTGFYQSLKDYVMHLSQLESQLGFTVSNLNGAKNEF